MINIENIGVIKIGDLEIIISETIVNTWIVMAILIVFALIARIALRNFKTVPTGFQNIIETIVESFDNFVTETVGPKLSYVAPYFFAVFVFILSSSVFSIFGMRSPTADWATTAALALATFVIMLVLGFRHRKGDYLKSFFEPMFIMFPLNLVNELAKPVSLSFRLFGNVLSGTVIIILYYGLMPLWTQIGIPAAIHAFFDILFGALQTYIFVILSLMYIKGAADD